MLCIEENYSDYEQVINNEFSKIQEIVNLDIRDYDKFALIVVIIKANDKMNEKLTQSDKYIINFLRNTTIHGTAFSHFEMIDQVFRYDIIEDNLYIDYDVINSADFVELVYALENSEILQESKHFDDEMTKKTYNSVNEYGITIAINIPKFIKATLERLHEY